MCKQEPGRLLHKKLANEAYVAHHLGFQNTLRAEYPSPGLVNLLNYGRIV